MTVEPEDPPPETALCPVELDPGGSRLDANALTHLLALAGPVDGPELMRRLTGDLGGVMAGITVSLANKDSAAMRHHSHVLLGIAGAIGAQQIYELAQHLNEWAKDKGTMNAAPQATAVTQHLSHLIGHLRLLSGQMGMV